MSPARVVVPEEITFMSHRLLLSMVVLLCTAAPAFAMTPQEQLAIYSALSQGDFHTAVPLLQKAANEGDKNCMANLAALYTTGIPGVLPKSDAQALQWYTRAAAKMDAEALAALGGAYMNGTMGAPRNYAKAKECFDKAISLGNSRSKAGLATMYLKGWGVEQNLAEAFKLTKEAAFQKVPGASFNLAEYYRLGIGCDKNEKEATDWYTKAAPGLLQQLASYPQSGELNCACGILFKTGRGVPQDDARAAKYFASAIPKLKAKADTGSTTAMLQYSELMENGWGMAKNSAGAMALLKKAAAAGDGEAKFLLTTKSAPAGAPATAPAAAPAATSSPTTEAN